MRWFFGKRGPDSVDATLVGMTLAEEIKEEPDQSDVTQDPEPSATSVPALAPDSGSDIDPSPEIDIGTDSSGGGYDGDGGGFDPS